MLSDIVLVTAGSTYPLIIRHSNNLYKFISACYIQNIMWGEAWHDDGLPDAEPMGKVTKPLSVKNLSMFLLI
jgi:hypothetical protein